MILRPRQQRDSAAARDPNWEGWRAINGGMQSATGEAVSRDKALMLPAVWQAVAMISGDVAKLPLDLYRKSGVDGTDRTVAKDHPAEWIVRRIANDEPMTAGQFWRQIMGDALIWNNAYAFIEFDRSGRPYSMIPMLPDRTFAQRTKSGLMYVTEVDGQRYALHAYEVLHIRGMMLTDSGGSGDAPSLLSAARDCIAVGLAAQRFEAKSFKNGLKSGGILQLPPGMPKDARDRLEEGFRKTYESEDGWFRTVVLREGATFHSISQSHLQGQTHELREDQTREVARLFNLPPSRLGLSDSVAYNSKAEDNRAYLDSTLSPWLSMIADECWLKLLLPAEQYSDELYFEHNTASLLRLDLPSRYSAYQTGISAGFLLRSEARRFENLPAIEGIDEGETEPGDDPDDGDEMPMEDEDSAGGESMDSQQESDSGDEQNRWLARAKRVLTWAELTDVHDAIAPKRGWPMLGTEALRKRVRKAGAA
jgi:HK97 family phage portal protein